MFEKCFRLSSAVWNWERNRDGRPELISPRAPKMPELALNECVVKGGDEFWCSVPPGKVSTYPELDEEIDFLSAIITEQRTESRLPGTGQTIFTVITTFPLSE